MKYSLPLFAPRARFPLLSSLCKCGLDLKYFSPITNDPFTVTATGRPLNSRSFLSFSYSEGRKAHPLFPHFTYSKLLISYNRLEGNAAEILSMFHTLLRSTHGILYSPICKHLTGWLILLQERLVFLWSALKAWISCLDFFCPPYDFFAFEE